jgi:hypothetical protein
MLTFLEGCGHWLHCTERSGFKVVGMPAKTKSKPRNKKTDMSAIWPTRSLRLFICLRIDDIC